MSKKIGLCLTGGGARGAYQVGALDALEELGIFEKIEVFSGTSIGAANCIVAASNSVETAKNVWLNMPKDNLPKIARPKRDSEKKEEFRRFNAGVYSMEIFEQILRDNTDCNRLKERKVYVTISEGGESNGGFRDLLRCTMEHYIKKISKVSYVPLHELDNKDLIFKSVIASSSIPFFFAPVELDNKTFYDGGVYDNIPIQPLLDEGCEEIIIVHLHKHYMFNPNKIAPNVTFHEIKHGGLRMGKVLKFSDEQTKRLIRMGYEDTMTYFNKQKQ